MKNKIIIIAFLFLCMSCGERGYYTEKDVVVVADGNGKYSVKLSGTLSAIVFDNYEEAWKYGINWMNNYNKAVKRENMDWKEVARNEKIKR